MNIDIYDYYKDFIEGRTKLLIEKKYNRKTESFICKKCNEITVIDTTDIETWAQNSNGITLDGQLNNFYGVKCGNCGSSEYTYHIDNEFSFIIKTLNAKGYTTKAACAGHTDNTIFHSIGLPYILIDMNRYFIEWVISSKDYLRFKELIEIILWDNAIGIYPAEKPTNTTQEFIDEMRKVFQHLANDLPPVAAIEERIIHNIQSLYPVFKKDGSNEENSKDSAT